MYFCFRLRSSGGGHEGPSEHYTQLTFDKVQLEPQILSNFSDKRNIVDLHRKDCGLDSKAKELDRQMKDLDLERQRQNSVLERQMRNFDRHVLNLDRPVKDSALDRAVKDSGFDRRERDSGFESLINSSGEQEDSKVKVDSSYFINFAPAFKKIFKLILFF